MPSASQPSRRAAISSRIRRNTSSRSSSLPRAWDGSSKLQCRRRRATREDRAPFVRAVADGDDDVPRLVEESIERLRAMGAEVDADFLHRMDGEWIDVRLLRPGALHVERAHRRACRRKPSAIWLRAELWVQRNSTPLARVTWRPYPFPRPRRAPRLGQVRHQPAEQRRRGRRADELRHDEAGRRRPAGCPRTCRSPRARASPRDSRTTSTP